MTLSDAQPITVSPPCHNSRALLEEAVLQGDLRSDALGRIGDCTLFDEVCKVLYRGQVELRICALRQILANVAEELRYRLRRLQETLRRNELLAPKLLEPEVPVGTE